MRILGGLLALVGIFIGVLGLGGSSSLCFISLAPLIIGALLFAAAQRRDKADKEEERHEEMLEAIRQGKSKE